MSKFPDQPFFDSTAQSPQSNATYMMQSLRMEKTAEYIDLTHVAKPIGKLRDEDELKELNELFKTDYDMDIEKALTTLPLLNIKHPKKRDPNNKLKDVLINKVMTIPKYRAKCLHQALTSRFKNVKTMYMIICTDEYIPETKEAFKQMYQKDLIAEISKATNGPCNTLLVGLLEGKKVDGMLQEDQQKLDACKEKKKEFATLVAEIFATRPTEDILRLTYTFPRKLDRQSKRALKFRESVLKEARMKPYSDAMRKCYKKSNNNPRIVMEILWFERSDRITLYKNFTNNGENPPYFEFTKKISFPLYFLTWLSENPNEDSLIPL